MTQSWYQLDWVWTTTGWLLAVLGAALLLYALFKDRARGRRRCPRCWYDISGVPGLQCPECGRHAKSEHHLTRTRRRWRWLPLAAIPMLAAYPVAHAPRILQVGAIGAVPTTALIEWVARNEPPEKYVNRKMSPPTPAAAELARRARTERMWGWQWRMLILRLHILRWRERWPEGVPWEVTLSIPTWLEAGVPVVVNLPEHLSYVPGYPPNSTARITKVSPIGLPIRTQPLPRGAESVVVQVSAGNWRGTMSLGVRQTSRVEDAITPVTNAAIDALVLRSLRSNISTAPNAATGTNLMLGAKLYRENGPLPEDLAIGLIVELRRDGSSAGAWPLCLVDSKFGPATDWIRISMPEPGWNVNDPEDMKRWSVRIRGDPAVALGDAQRDRCWAGEYTFPLSDYLP